MKPRTTFEGDGACSAACRHCGLAWEQHLSQDGKATCPPRWRAISLTQPWATLVALEWKRIETRSWRTDYEGPIAIHAAKNFPGDARQLCNIEPFSNALSTFDLLSGDLPLGAIIATADLRTCRATADVRAGLSPWERAFGNYADGRWAWYLTNVQKLAEPIPCKGALGLWKVPPDIAVRLAA